ncbi:MAG: alpha-ketoglutarate-dependent dioxygenase AlkB [Bdellovibrionales bacterium]|nr:alpha-ketoglutarate-dependent dioxygenase AlkB [Bdellovibrionales bacterium]
MQEGKFRFSGSTSSLLPFPCEVFLLEEFLSPSTCAELFEQVRGQVRWQTREISLFGKKVLQPRLVAWQGDSGCSYRYSGITWNPDLWSPAVERIRELLAAATGFAFNGVLLNLYRDGRDSMGWHSDDEPELGQNPVIASVSLGASRRFLFRNRLEQKQKVEVDLKDGSLLIMSGPTQQLWQHSLPRSAKAHEARINLTFRKIMF